MIRCFLLIPGITLLISCAATQGTQTPATVQQGEPTYCEEQTIEIFETPENVPGETINADLCPVNESEDGKNRLAEQDAEETETRDASPERATEQTVPAADELDTSEPEVLSPDAPAAERAETPGGSSPGQILEPLLCASDSDCEEQGLGVATGTGFFISTDGYVVTNDHVIADYREVYVIFDEEPLEAVVIDRDSDLDIALLKIQASTEALPVDLITPRKGEEVAVIGYPSVQLLGNEVKATFGHINSLSGPQNTPIFLQFSAATQPGNSGSPLLNSKGSVIGLVTASLNQASALEQTGALAQNVNFALKTEFFSPTLGLVSGWQSPDPAIADMEATEVVEQSEDSVVLILNIYESGSLIQTERRKVSEALVIDPDDDGSSTAQSEQEAMGDDAVGSLPETESDAKSGDEIDAVADQSLGHETEPESVEQAQASSDARGVPMEEEFKAKSEETEAAQEGEHSFDRYILRTESDDER